MMVANYLPIRDIAIESATQSVTPWNLDSLCVASFIIEIKYSGQRRLQLTIITIRRRLVSLTTIW